MTTDLHSIGTEDTSNLSQLIHMLVTCFAAMGLRRARTDLEGIDDVEMTEVPDRRPKSGKRFMKKKTAFAMDIPEGGDDDF